MKQLSVISGSSEVYASEKMKDFNQSAAYPLAWEIIFRNDAQGIAFATDMQKVFATMPKTKGKIVEGKLDPNEPVRCIECVFKDKDSFRAVVNQVLTNRSIMNETKGEVIPKLVLLQQAGKVMQQKMALAV